MRSGRGSSADSDVRFLFYFLQFETRGQTRRQEALGKQEVFATTTSQPSGSASEHTVAAKFSKWATDQYRKALQASTKFHVVTTERCTDGRDRWGVMYNVAAAAASTDDDAAAAATYTDDDDAGAAATATDVDVDDDGAPADDDGAPADNAAAADDDGATDVDVDDDVAASDDGATDVDDDVAASDDGATDVDDGRRHRVQSWKAATDSLLSQLLTAGGKKGSV